MQNLVDDVISFLSSPFTEPEEISNNTAFEKQQPTSQLSPKSPRSPILSPERQLQRDAMKLRLTQMKEELNGPKINMKKIMELSMGGLLDDLRPTYWRLLLNYLPTDRTQWEKELTAKRELYWTWQRDLPVDPHVNTEDNVTEIDHPLNDSHSSQWNQFFIDANTRQEIEKDVHRTFPHLNFFQDLFTMYLLQTQI